MMQPILLTRRIAHHVERFAVAHVRAGGGFTCAQMVGGTIRCWGDNGSGQLGNGPSSAPVLNADCRIMAFASDATNLVASDTNATTDVFVHVDYEYEVRVGVRENFHEPRRSPA